MRVRRQRGSIVPSPRTGASAYAYCAGPNSVLVIDTATNKVKANVSLGAGAQPGNVTITPNGMSAYVANRNSGSLSVINTGTNTVKATVGGTNPMRVVITPDGRGAYVPDAGSNSVS